VLFTNFAEAMAEGRGKAQADTLRKARTDITHVVLGRSGPKNLFNFFRQSLHDRIIQELPQTDIVIAA